MKIDDNGFVILPGSDGWRDAYQIGSDLDDLFPGQDADQFAYGCEYNDWGPLWDEELGITKFTMLIQGERDGGAWEWIVEISNGDLYSVTGWCDYTGWDCRSGMTWMKI